MFKSKVRFSFCVLALCFIIFSTITPSAFALANYSFRDSNQSIPQTKTIDTTSTTSNDDSFKSIDDKANDKVIKNELKGITKDDPKSLSDLLGTVIIYAILLIFILIIFVTVFKRKEISSHEH